MSRFRERRPESKHFVFRRHANIGAADALEDKRFLSESFVDNGALAILSDNDQPQCIVVGRTGSGKTALLEHLATTKDKVIRIAPEGLGFTHVSDSGVLGFFLAAGVNMDLFYRLLWRHVLTVEIIREHYHIVNEKARDDFLAKIRYPLHGNRSRQNAIDYLMNWGESFWKESEYRVREVTGSLEDALSTSVSGTVVQPSVARSTLSADLARKLTEEQRAEVVHRGQAVVERVRLNTLSEIMDLLDQDVLDDPQEIYHMTIDRLDENWVDDDLRYRLLRALLETIRDFNTHIRNLKVIAAIREDLLDRVFRLTRAPGYQEEKYKSLCLRLTWREEELEHLLDRRVGQLIREQYTASTVRVRDVLPERVGESDPVAFILSRTLLRPRDAIMFFNECIQVAEGKARITQSMVQQAERAYSENRLRALADEWSADYPNLMELVQCLRGFPGKFGIDYFVQRIAEPMEALLIAGTEMDHIRNTVDDKLNIGDPEGFTQEVLKILFHVGIVGVKPEHASEVLWSYQGQKLLGSDINRSATFYMHPAFWRTLGVVPE